MYKHITLIAMILSLASLAAGPRPAPQTPGDTFTPPTRPTAAGVPSVFEHTGEAGPDQTFFAVGENLAGELTAWGGSADGLPGREWKPKVQFVTPRYLTATMPERAPDGVFMVWARNEKGWSAPLVLNVPQPWWCGPDVVTQGGQARLFGRNLARRPDFARAFVYLCQDGKPGVWAQVPKSGKYAVTFGVPENLPPGEYQVFVHAGSGGDFGWGGPVPLRVEGKSPKTGLAGLTANASSPPPTAPPTALPTGPELQRTLDDLSARGGGTFRLPPGQVQFSGTLRIPANVTLAGGGRDSTTLQLIYNPTVRFARLDGPGWNQAPGAVHSIGDTIEYELVIPKAGTWNIHLRYATDMKQWNQTGVSGNHTLAVDDQAPSPLMNLENTGGWGTFKWSKSASVNLAAGKHKLTWKNVKGGGISLDAFLFAAEAAYVPVQEPPPVTGDNVLVLQAEDCIRFVTKEGQMPGGNRAAVWLAGDGASIADLTILGTSQVNYGIAVLSPQPGTWLKGCAVDRVRIADCDGKQGENCAAFVRYANYLQLRDSELWGRTPLFISGAKQSQFANNRLVSVTRFGGNAEAAILGRNETIEQCVIEGNLIASPPGATAGGPTARRLLWFSTGHGSISQNFISGNGVEKPNGPGANVGAGQARFGGVAGTDQNVGEMILFEGHHRTAYFGPLAGASEQTVILPKTIPATPDDRLGNVDRKQLAHDADGNETPFFPPAVDDGGQEPPIHEYYVSVMNGAGQGQTRRVLRRQDQTLYLDRPWTVPPAAGSVVCVGTAFYRNLIVDNHAPDGMTGIQLWISCMENIVAGNTIARQRKPGLFLYANGTTLASSMPRTWNRGISPLFWNICEGNRTEECSAGALVTSGDSPNLPVEFPRALGNVLRHNSFIRNRTDGVVLTSRGTPAGVKDTAASITGTIVEFNVVRDAQVGYHAASSCDAVVFRRNHAYFWYPVSRSTDAPVAFQVDKEDAKVALELNSVESVHGVNDKQVIDFKTPSGVKKLE